MRGRTMATDKYGYNIPPSWNKTKGEVMAKGKFSNEDKQGMALMLIATLKEKVTDITAKDISSIMSTAYTIARKGAHGNN